jgi:hypothetical protein
MNIVKILLATLLIVFLASCENKIEEYDSVQYDKLYFPLETGNKWGYQLDSIIYTKKGTQRIERSYTVNEEVIDVFTDSRGEKSYLIEQNVLENDQPYVTNLFYGFVDDNKAVRTEGNLKFIKLVFPVSLNNSWDGNAMFDASNTIVKIGGEPINMYEWWNYRYTEINGSETINGTVYADVVTVTQVDSDIPIEKRYSVEKYAKGIGLIYQKMIILNTQRSDQISTPWEEKAEEGFILDKRLLYFSK